MLSLVPILYIFQFYFSSGHAQVYLAITSNPVFCFGSEVVLVCRYPTVLEVYNKQYKYRTFLPNWECSCRKFILDANGTIAISLNSTAQKLQIPVKTEIFGDSPCSCECYLYLANRTKDKSDPVLLQPLKPDAPSLFVLNPSSNSVDIHWNHSITVDCYKRCYFSFDVQLYEMNSKDPIDSKSLLGLSIRFSFLDVNKSYTAEIKSLCVLNGMNIFSKPLQVNFLTKVPRSPINNLSRIPDNSTSFETNSTPPFLHVVEVIAVVFVVVVVVVVLVSVIVVTVTIVVKKKYAHKSGSRSNNLKVNIDCFPPG